MTADLKPCDFCGNNGIQDWGESTWSRPVKWMYCTECQARGPRVMLERNESEDAWLQRAIDHWNARAPLDGAVATEAQIDAAARAICCSEAGDENPLPVPDELMPPQWEVSRSRYHKLALAALRGIGGGE